MTDTASSSYPHVLSRQIRSPISFSSTHVSDGIYAPHHTSTTSAHQIDIHPPTSQVFPTCALATSQSASMSTHLSLHPTQSQLPLWSPYSHSSNLDLFPCVRDRHSSPPARNPVYVFGDIPVSSQKSRIMRISCKGLSFALIALHRIRHASNPGRMLIPIGIGGLAPRSRACIH